MNYNKLPELDLSQFDADNILSEADLMELRQEAEAGRQAAAAKLEAEAPAPRAEKHRERPAKAEKAPKSPKEDEPASEPAAGQKKKSAPALAAGIIGRILAFVLATVILILCGALGVIYMLSRGPSESARDLFVLSVRETSAVGFLAEIFLSEEQVLQIEADSKPQIEYDSVDTSLITIAPAGPEAEGGESGEDVKDIEILDVSGSTFNGKLMIVRDPKRVIVGVTNQLGVVGQPLAEMIESYGGVGGVNGGGFEDLNGTGNGGIPDGIVIHEGKLLYGQYKTAPTAVLDADGILHVGNMTGQEALDLGAEYALSFGPVLVVNGTKCDGLSSGLNPRTAIGQRSDGAILLLVINGRQLGSMGATYGDVADVLMEYGAVNALNLDGGSSSTMIYEGEFLNISSSLVGQRGLPTGIIVLDEKEG